MGGAGQQAGHVTHLAMATTPGLVGKYKG